MHIKKVRMKKIVFFLLLVNSRGIFAQPPEANLEMMDKWPTLTDEAISNDGKFALYHVSTHPFSREEGETHIEVCSLDGAIKIVFPGARSASFSGDSRWLVALGTGDSLVIMDLWQRVEKRYYTSVESFKISDNRERYALTAIELKSKALVVFDLNSNVSHLFEGATAFGFSDSCSYLYVINKVVGARDGVCQVSLVDNSNGIDTVWRGADVEDVIFDADSAKIAFLGKKDSTSRGFSIWTYDQRRRLLLEPIKESGGVLGDSFAIQQAEFAFLPKINALTFAVQSRVKEAKTTIVAQSVSVWSYQDEYLKGSREERDRDYLNRNVLFVVFLDTGRIVQLGKAGDGQGGPRVCINSAYSYAYVVNDANVKEGYRLLRERPNIYLINLFDGSRKCIASHIRNAWPAFSPAGKFIIWYDIDLHEYYTYNIATRVVRNISKGVPVPLYDVHPDQKGGRHYGISNWTDDDRSVLVNDEFDIWKLDPNGSEKPVNVTRSYGRLHRIVFRSTHYQDFFSKEEPFGIDDSVLLCAFDEHTKQNGFYEMFMSGKKEPQRLVMSDDVYAFPEPIYWTIFPSFIIRSANKKFFLLRKMNARTYPNLYSTSDFKTFTKISSLDPERGVNWLTTELVHWKTFLGKSAEGVLYRPENFDSTRKYPMIVYVYEIVSPELNVFDDIEPSRGPMNIPWFVSRGYLVFCPDIHFTVGDPGSGIYDYVVSGAQMMAKRSWVDSGRMGIQGHSQGGYEVNYLITRTKLFHAAVSAAGVSDLVSLYGLEGFAYGAGPAAAEQRQSRMGASLGECPRCYINNSPVFRADRVETPLLLMQNPKDPNVPWEQSLEYYIGLRRLGKKVWFVQYANANHIVLSGIDVLDYTQKMTEFFDYYLKGSPFPEWMN